MMKIVQLPGTDRLLYELVAPLVMNPAVLKQNYNYPFRTSEDFIWFIALEDNAVVGFMPVEKKKGELVINNYYIKGNDESILKQLLEEAINRSGEEANLAAVVFIEHSPLFKEFGFTDEKIWTRYVKMRKGK